MKDEEFVKLSAIERMAKPMSAFHGGKGASNMTDAEEDYAEGETEDGMAECPECGCKFEIED